MPVRRDRAQARHLHGKDQFIRAVAEAWFCDGDRLNVELLIRRGTGLVPCWIGRDQGPWDTAGTGRGNRGPSGPRSCVDLTLITWINGGKGERSQDCGAKTTEAREQNAWIEEG